MESQHWDERYRAAEHVWSLDPNRSLVEETAELPPGRALDVGSGEGRNAIWLAKRGWRVTGIDFSAVAVAKARERALAEGVSVEWVQADLRDHVPQSEAFDLVVIMYMHADPADRRLLLARMCAAVAPGGRILVVGHDVRNLTEGVGGPRDPARLFTPETIAGELAGVRVQRAERVFRPVETEGGQATAIDTLVRAVKEPPPAAR